MWQVFNDSLMKNEMLWQSVQQNQYFYWSILVCAAVLAWVTQTSFILAILTFVYASFVGYAGHASVHCINFTKAYEECTNPILKNNVATPILTRVCKYMDFHDQIHHDTGVNKQIKHVLIEFVLNFITQGGLLIVMVLLCRYVNVYVVLLWALAYCTVHNINYDYLNPVSHQLHHKDNSTNYGIDIWDILFGTKYPGDAIENINHYAINMVLITAIIVLCFID
jgi:hypothetical protein